MTRLWLCEKPSQGRDIARVLGVGHKGDGCLEGATDTVTWCFGHLLEMAPPDTYGEAYKRWSLDALPIVPDRWRQDVKGSASRQFRVIRQLLGQASEVVIATDADREGEMIAREVLDACQYRGPVQRLWLSALDEASIRKALAALMPGEKTYPLYLAGLGRARADWLVGMNLTRAYTLMGRQAGHDGVLSVGRVQTPTLRLVVDRDREIEAFVPKPYWEVVVQVAHARGGFRARWVPPEAAADAEGRCISEQTARQVAQRLTGASATVTQVHTERVREAPPLPLDLGTLQQEASRRWGMGAQQVLECAQALYEKHKATTYPRTDCPYLPTSQLSDVEQVMTALMKSDPGIERLVQGADHALQSRAWNDAKITAHHAIIPTSAPCRIDAMSESERRLYDLIRRRYLAQFYPRHEFDRTDAALQAGEDRLKASGKQVCVTGWRILFQGDDQAQDKTGQTLPPLSRDERCQVAKADVEAKQTTPPARYTEGTLIAAMKGVARLIDDPKLKKMLKESAGIGTEATRAGIIETLLKRGYLVKQKKHLLSTDTARALVDALPAPVKDPGTTALWEQALDEIAQGRQGLDGFLAKQTQWVTVLVQRVQSSAQAGGPGVIAQGQPAHPCPACGQALRRRKGKDGFFWGCSAYPQCRQTLPDSRGKPGKPKATRKRPGSDQGKHNNPAAGVAVGGTCPFCGQGQLVQRTMKNGQQAGRPFLGCTRFPQCKHFAWVSEDSARARKAG
ncbi:DNA topoisomerase III [Ectothiorhodospira variabilis]|uniref:DNA topoisomerase III n=1 Tax=Ectothiorhodospira variabilis TaxID=505694 RepID=UPI001EFB706E|nr:DNA topoisomerase III [Ectothiorhodospira variabilis]MCG5495528.1 DNA topoisomerase III [Ectothiorhodospira variabilis]MCG5505136.1 DNA topoisomerase III [Ectothiorhodospira variabilis]MCG5508293.1 DNA topoisomerase III [Ectothiorhodospira variabilis]